MLQIPGATSFMGCIGKDKFGEEMRNNAQTAGVNVKYNLASTCYDTPLSTIYIAQSTTLTTHLFV
jgi:sugar/nucleoside kinase (ribokinase family)